MAVSANALFHFTDSIDILKSIVRNGFYPRYCMEKKDFLRVYPANKLRYSASPTVGLYSVKSVLPWSGIQFIPISTRPLLWNQAYGSINSGNAMLMRM